MAEQVESDVDQNGTDPAFDKALEGLRATGASVEVVELVQLLARHGKEEGRLLAEYQAVEDSTNDPAAKYLVGLILDDERRHHLMLVEMANSIAWDTLSETPEPSLPRLSWRVDEKLLEQTRQLRQAEEQDRRELESMRRRLRPYADTTVWSLVLEIMLLDTDKHATILRFLEDHSRAH